MALATINRLTTVYRGPITGAELPYEDGEPLESQWHLDAMHLLIRILRYHFREQGNVFVGGNMFVYFDPDQDRRKNFRGPDLFVVKGVTSLHYRDSWVIWEEDFLAPNVAFELASPSSSKFDVNQKKGIYEQSLQTPEYIVYDPQTKKLQGWRLVNGQYRPITPNADGWLWLNELELWLGLAEYELSPYQRQTVLRLFDRRGHILPTVSEVEAEQAFLERLRADEAKQHAEIEQLRADEAERRAEYERQRAEQAEAELVRLRAMLEERAKGDEG